MTAISIPTNHLNYTSRGIGKTNMTIKQNGYSLFLTLVFINRNQLAFHTETFC